MWDEGGCNRSQKTISQYLEDTNIDDMSSRSFDIDTVIDTKGRYRKALTSLM